MAAKNNPKDGLDPFRILEYPVAVFCLNITLFTILWKSIGLSWLPFQLDERFQEIFTEGYYARDLETRENEYRLLFLFLYGILGTTAQIASLFIARIRRNGGAPGVHRYVFAGFHVLIAVYHVLFVFQIVQGKMILDGMASWQMFASKTLYLLELLMACELLFATRQTFFRRKVCLDLVSACNLIPFLIFWGFAAGGLKNHTLTKIVEYSFFAVMPLSILLIEWATWGLRAFGRRRE